MEREMERKASDYHESSSLGSVGSRYEFDEDGKLRRVTFEFEGDAKGTVVVLPRTT